MWYIWISTFTDSRELHAHAASTGSTPLLCCRYQGCRPQGSLYHTRPHAEQHMLLKVSIIQSSTNSRPPTLGKQVGNCGRLPSQVAGFASVGNLGILKCDLSDVQGCLITFIHGLELRPKSHRFVIDKPCHLWSWNALDLAGQVSSVLDLDRCVFQRSCEGRCFKVDKDFSAAGGHTNGVDSLDSVIPLILRLTVMDCQANSLLDVLNPAKHSHTTFHSPSDNHLNLSSKSQKGHATKVLSDLKIKTLQNQNPPGISDSLFSFLGSWQWFKHAIFQIWVICVRLACIHTLHFPSMVKAKRSWKSFPQPRQ